MATLTAVRGTEQVRADMAQQWRQQAVCHGRSALMDPGGGLDGDDRRDARLAARAVCQSCPVIDACTVWVMGLSEQDDPGGMCAGLTEDQRKSRRRAALKGRHRKTCTQCGINKPVEQFYAAPKSPDGRRWSCKACDKKQAAARRQRQAEQAVAS